MIVREVTGEIVPPTKIPRKAAVGAVVDNIATIYAIGEAMEGKTFTHKYLTVTGEVAHSLSSASRSAPACRRALILPAAQRAAIPNIMTGGPSDGQACRAGSNGYGCRHQDDLWYLWFCRKAVRTNHATA